MNDGGHPFDQGQVRLPTDQFHIQYHQVLTPTLTVASNAGAKPFDYPMGNLEPELLVKAPRCLRDEIY